MPTAAWDEAKRSKGDEVVHMKKLIPYYSYADERAAVMTDRRFCLLLRNELSGSKSLFHDAMDWFYKAKLEDMHLGRISDDLGILMDEVEIKNNKWDERIPREFLEKVMEYDWSLIQKSRALKDDLSVLINALHIVNEKSDKKTLGDVNMSMDVVHQKVDDITKMFKEREAAFDITQLGFRDTFRIIKDKIRKSI
jgi:hypothetical protein